MLKVETYQTMAEAAGALNDRSRFLAGGTLLMRDVTYGDQSFDTIVRSQRVEGGVSTSAGGLRIGAGTTMSDVLASRDLDFLHPVVRVIGGPAIRNMATVGGNLFAENPFGDLTTALLALDARIEMSDGQSQPIETFLAGRDRVRGLVTAVLVARPDSGAFGFHKVSRVKPKGASVISVAVNLRRNEPRVAFGNMGPTPLRAKEAERALVGGDAAAAAAVCLDGLSPVSDPLASEWYRREVAPVHLTRALQDRGLR